MFPQVSGMTMIVDPRRRLAIGCATCASTASRSSWTAYTVGIADFIFRGGDGYTMFAGQRVLVGPETGTLISIAIEKYVAAQREITQQVDGRITLR